MNSRVRRHRPVKHRRPICARTGKCRYRDGDDAGLALRGMKLGRARAELDKAPHQINVVRKYPCDHCDGWHLTSWPEWTTQTTAALTA